MASIVPTPTWRQLIMSSTVSRQSRQRAHPSGPGVGGAGGQLQQPQIKVGGEPGKI